MKKYFVISIVALVVALAVFVGIDSKENSKQDEEKKASAETVKGKKRVPLNLPGLSHIHSDQVSQKVKQVANNELTDNERMVILYDLQYHGELTSADEEFLRRFLLNGDFKDSYAVKNDTIELLVRKSHNMEETAHYLFRILSESPDEILREYTLQYAHELYLNYFKGYQELEYTEFTSLMFQLLEEKNSTIAGAALFALDKISEDFDIDTMKLMKHAGELIANKEFSISSRVAAAQYLYKSSFPEHRRLLTKTAIDEKETVMVRMASIKSLEKQGLIDEKFKSFLKGLAAESSDSRLQYVASTTLKNINN